VLSTALSMPGAANRWPSVHACQFQAQYAAEDAYLSAAPPPCRWRSCLLPSHKLDAKHTLVGGDASLYVFSQGGGERSAIDSVACTEVVGGGAWRPPQTFVPLRCAGRTPTAVEGFVAVYTHPIAGMRLPVPPPPDSPIAEYAGGGDGEDEDEDEDDRPPPPPPPKKEEKEGEEGEDAEPTTMNLGSCVWLLGGTSPIGTLCTLDMYSIEEERWLGDPFQHEEDAAVPPAVNNPAACVLPAADGAQAIFLFGGKRQDGALSDELWCFEPQSLAWSHVAGAGEPPAARELATITRVLTRYLFVHGGMGYENTPCVDVSLFDTITSTWSTKSPSPPLPRLGHAAGAAAGCLYIYGGADANNAPTNDVYKYAVHEHFPQVAALRFDADPNKAMLAKASPSLNGIADKFSLEAWVCPNDFLPNGVCVTKSDASFKTGFGLVSIDEATAKKYVQLEKLKPPEAGQPKERNPWEGCLADAERLPTMAFFIAGMKRETSALLRVLPHQWSHIAASFDGKTLITYVNGLRADYFTLEPPLEEQGGMTHPKDGDLAIGGFAGRYAFDGLIDGVRVWNHTLSWEEVRERMNDTLLGVDYPTLVGQWSCNEGAGELCVDSSKFHNHGYLEGEVERALCTRDRVELKTNKTAAELHVDESFDRMRVWRNEFEKRAGREVTQADLLLAEESIRKTARRLGLIS